MSNRENKSWLNLPVVESIFKAQLPNFAMEIWFMIFDKFELFELIELQERLTKSGNFFWVPLRRYIKFSSQKFLNKYPVIRGLQTGGCVVAGSIVLRWLVDESKWIPGDIDFYCEQNV